ncbi:hypothetical protein TanjilG_07064 [Lupinus angustifolius]|uniref:Uncharacterized protein n=1 Tax=Lupinus angustifolius TaxID=3871 RepID=A0A4P1QXU0_LUPAN|nr:hypothetical protein TanjilG_07064 [Lupinus angustifolius]
MAFQRSSTMTLNLMFLLCLVAIINNHVTLTSARELKNPSSEENKEITSNESGENQAYPTKNNNKTNEEKEEIVSEKSVGIDEAEDPNKNKKNNNKAMIGKGLTDEKQTFPFPFPWPWPMQPPLGGFPFPSPFDIPMIPPFPFPPFSFPPLDIPGIVPSPPA